MNLKNAALLALIGAALLTLLLLAGLVNDVLGVVRGFLPPVRLVVQLIETFAGVAAVVFFYVVHRRQI
jgi:hypothetical protein